MNNISFLGSTFNNTKGFIIEDTSGNNVSFVHPEGSINITTNGTINVSEYASAVVNIEEGGSNQDKTVTPTESVQYVTADAGYDGLGQVTVNAISGTYVGTQVARKSSSDLTASGATVTVPSGYYAAEATKTISNGGAATPATTVTANPSISVNSNGLITATASATQSVTPTVSAGYVSSGTAGTITVSGSNTQQLSTQAAQTIYPSSTDQTIASGKYLTGTQTIKGVTISGLSAENIVSGVTVKIGDTADDDRIASVTGTASTGGGATINNQDKTVTPTESQQTITADSGYTGLGTVTVNAISNTYVGSGIAQKSSSDLTASGATVTVPSGYYSSSASKTIASGNAGTPTATKGSVSNHSISVTPSVTNTTGYITGGTKTGTAVSVNASELVSGTKSISANGTGIDVTNYATVDVSVPPEESSDFIITLNKDANDKWIPDCTFAEYSAAVTANKNIVLNLNISNGDGGAHIQEQYDIILSYEVIHDGLDYSTNTSYTVWEFYDFTSSGVTLNGTYRCYDTGTATATSSDVLNGVTFFNGNGKQTGSIQTKSSSDLTVSGSTVTVPVGYYSAQASKSVASGSATAPASISETSATVSTGTNTLTLTKTVSVTPNVTTAGYISSGTAGNASVSLTASVTTKGATTYHPSTSDQTISSGTYTTGTQTIKAVTVSGLSASSILSGTTVKIGDSTDDDCVTSVSGSVTFATIYTGTSTPSASSGVNGDIYIKTAS